MTRPLWEPMVPDEGFGPTSECSLTIEERVIQIEQSETHESSIAKWTPNLLDGPSV